MSYGRQYKRLAKYNNTQIINGYERYVFEYGEDLTENTSF